MSRHVGSSTGRQTRDRHACAAHAPRRILAPMRAGAVKGRKREHFPRRNCRGGLVLREPAHGPGRRRQPCPAPAPQPVTDRPPATTQVELVVKRDRLHGNLDRATTIQPPSTRVAPDDGPQPGNARCPDRRFRTRDASASSWPLPGPRILPSSPRAAAPASAATLITYSAAGQAVSVLPTDAGTHKEPNSAAADSVR